MSIQTTLYKFEYKAVDVTRYYAQFGSNPMREISAEMFSRYLKGAESYETESQDLGDRVAVSHVLKLAPLDHFRIKANKNV